ncbi:MAG: DUF4128 domain-containing protein, partial [Hyphomonas sp.]|nr:DUF4128 domain-containing protein [Hyphomonas sp.]
AALAAVADGFSPAIPVAWENRDFTPPEGRHFVADFIPAPKERLTIGTHHRAAGSLAVVVASRTNMGTGEALGLAGAIVAGFPCDTRLETTDGKTIRITAEPSIRQGFKDGGWWRTPVIIPWEVI